MATRTLTASSVPPAALSGPAIERWRALQAADPGLASPYLTPEFTLAVAGVRGDVRVAMLADDAGPCAFFPYQRRGSDAWPVGSPLNDFQAVIAAPGSRWTPADLLRATGAACVHFDHWIDQPEVVGHVETTTRSPFADLRQGSEAYFATIAARSDQLRKVDQRRRKLVREHGEPRFALHGDRAALAQVITWKSAQFRRSGLANPFAHPWTHGLLAAIHRHRDHAFAGWLSTLHAGDRLIAAHFGMRSGTVLHYWFPVYDHAFHQYGPGLLLLTEILRAAAAEGIARVEFGKGDDAWKPRFMTGASEVGEGRIERPGLRRSMRRLQRGAAAVLRRSPLRRLGAWPLRQLRSLAAHRRMRA